MADLAIAAWTMVVSAWAVGYLLRFSEAERRHLPLMGSVLFFLSWLGPMGAIGLGLWTGRLSIISRALDSRRQVALIASGFMLVRVGVGYWLSTWNVSTERFSAADWRFAFVVDTVASLFVGAVAVALIVWMAPLQRQQRTPRLAG